MNARTLLYPQHIINIQQVNKLMYEFCKYLWEYREERKAFTESSGSISLNFLSPLKNLE